MTTHVFIVDNNTFKYHLEYMFAGTGAGNNFIDFNSVGTTNLHYATENNLLGMIADISRIRIGDNVVFYLQQDYSKGIYEGKFYGIFRVRSLGFLDNNDGGQFLINELQKSLTFRILIEPLEVYADGVTEWEALDEIKNICSPNQMLWSLIYRKLKGNRGNTMITIYEFERLYQLIREKNYYVPLGGQNFSFYSYSQQIIQIPQSNSYDGRFGSINILPRLLAKYEKGHQFETHLQAYILQNIEQIFNSGFEWIEWIGNEVSCGVGMQRIDIMLSKINGINRVCMPIELKSSEAYLGITHQIQRYVDWIRQYYLPNRQSDLVPVLISRQILDKNSQYFSNLIAEFQNFNAINNINLKYIEFTIENNSINFSKIVY